MKLIEVLDHIDAVSYEIPEQLREFGVKNLCHNSRLADNGSLFVCKKGAVADGHAYAASAYNKGARCFIAERELDIPKDAAVIIVQDANIELCKLAIEFYNRPAERLKIIGVTGTKGKTTVALSIYSVLSSAGYNVGYVGTNGAYYGGKIHETANTTPDCLELQRIFYEMLLCGVTTVVIEVSSQALWQNRIYGLKFNTCIFTNLYEDHIGGVEHPDIEHYKSCKRRLFTDYGAENVIVNADSSEWRYMVEGAECVNLIRTSSSGNKDCDLYATDKIKMMNGMLPGISFVLNSEKSTFTGSHDVFIPIPGEYSIENSLLCIAACLKLGLDLSDIVAHLSKATISGRFEPVLLESRPNSLFVIDYAHNGASLSAVLKTMREYCYGRIICLFGSVGGRTFGRRAELAQAAKALADIIIVTSDNPGDEDPQHIVDDIGKYLVGCDQEVFLIPDRQEAIHKAYELASDGDFVLLAGKGHEQYQLVGKEKIAFSEKEILLELDKMKSLT